MKMEMELEMELGLARNGSISSLFLQILKISICEYSCHRDASHQDILGNHNQWDRTSNTQRDQQLSASTKHISKYGSCRKTLKLMRKFST
uniref:HDC10341 n=1 Tax=Drosophila melanogaster TaxID=7227 RepID=Q6IL53_DROME|nr:TPA_inf: HDC10341 [Drosophila melanogaster]